jgi:hypothetical protein
MPDNVDFGRTAIRQCEQQEAKEQQGGAFHKYWFTNTKIVFSTGIAADFPIPGP